MEFLFNLSPTTQAFIATLMTWGITALGASLVFLFKKINKNFLDSMLGIAAGVMIAASFWSLLSPAINMATNLNMIPWLVIFIGFFGGGILLFSGDKFFNHLEKKSKFNKPHSLKRSLLLVFSITLHNIPEGLAIGVAFGSVVYGLGGATIGAAWVLAIGIGIQNFPEGTAVSIPLRREGLSRKQAFLWGQLSGVVEPISAIIGSILVLKIQTLLPYLLSFAAGAMIYVVVQELIPESQTNENKSVIALFTLLGFSIMMILDVALG